MKCQGCGRERSDSELRFHPQANIHCCVDHDECRKYNIQQYQQYQQQQQILHKQQAASPPARPFEPTIKTAPEPEPKAPSSPRPAFDPEAARVLAKISQPASTSRWTFDPEAALRGGS